MPITLNNGFITGLAAGGLPNSVILNSNIVAGTIGAGRLLLSGDWASLYSTPGYVKLANGTIIQFGLGIASSSAGTSYISASVTFPIAFTSVAYTVHTPINPLDTIALNYLAYPTTRDYTTTSFTCAYRKATTNGSFSMYYIAVGS